MLSCLNNISEVSTKFLAHDDSSINQSAHNLHGTSFINTYIKVAGNNTL